MGNDKKTPKEVQDELAAQEMASPGGKSAPPPSHPAMSNIFNPAANATDADDSGDYSDDGDY